MSLTPLILASERGLTAYRYGGEEFTLVFSHNKTETLAEKLEQVRARVADYPLVIRQQDRPKDSKSGESTEQLLKRADEALYSAKKAGRNQVAFAK